MFFFNYLKPRSGYPVACGISSLLVVAGIGVAAERPLAPRPSGPASFIDLVDHPTPEANWDRFYALEDRLAGAFLTACGEGVCLPRRFLWPMQLRCSVRVANGTVAACVWVIAGSDLRVRAAGSINPDVVIWRCALPLGAGPGVDVFHAALEVDDPLAVRLPGAAESLRQGLATCLARPGTSS